MSDKRNLIAFVISSMLLLFGYSWLTKKYSPPPPQVNQAVPDSAEANQQYGQSSANNAPEVRSANAIPPISGAPSQPAKPVQTDDTIVDINAKFTVSNDSLELTWRQYDGTLLQVIWAHDGTPFFPEETMGADGKLTSAGFLGIGGAIGTIFSGTPQLSEEADGKTITFANQSGERLSYYLPNKGIILDMQWHSPLMNNLYLIRSLNDIPQHFDRATGKLYPANPFQGLENGRVFTLEDKKIHDVTWDGILTDPWFKFLGRKRKELPSVTSRLGMDAGVEIDRKQPTHYFAAIWDSEQLPRRDISGHNGYNGYFAVPDSGGNVTARLYLGPKQAEYLSSFHPEGQPEKGKAFLQAMNFGFFGLIAKFMYVVLRYIQKFIPNWGWSLVIFGILIRLSLWSLNTKTTISMLRQKDLEPHQKQIQAKYEKHGRDMAKKQEMQKELMAFYKKNGHNPMGSCLPMLLQMPIFIALWSMLQNVFELRHAPWVFWIKDLSAPDPYYILPILMVGTMIAQQAITPPMGDPQQRKMMMVIMPLVMGFIFISLPAGLTIYYLPFNLVAMGQTWWHMRNYKPQPVVI